MDIKDIENLSTVDKNWRQYYLDYINKSNWEFPLLEEIAVHFNKSYSTIISDFERLMLNEYYIERYNDVSSFLYRISCYLPYVFNNTIIVPKTKLSVILGIDKDVLSEDLNELDKEYRIKVADEETSKNMFEVLGFILDDSDNIVKSITSEVIVAAKKCNSGFVNTVDYISKFKIENIDNVINSSSFQEKIVDVIEPIINENSSIPDSMLSDNYIERFNVINDIKSLDALNEFSTYISFYNKIKITEIKEKKKNVRKEQENKSKTNSKKDKTEISQKDEFLDNVDYEEKFLGVRNLVFTNLEYLMNNYFDSDNPLTIGQMARELSVIDSSVLNQINYLKKKEGMSLKILGTDMNNIDHKKLYYYVRYFNPKLEKKSTASEMSCELEIPVRNVYIDLEELKPLYEKSERSITISTKSVIEDVDIVGDIAQKEIVEIKENGISISKNNVVEDVDIVLDITPEERKEIINLVKG